MDEMSEIYHGLFDDEMSLAEKKEIVATLVAMGQENAEEKTIVMNRMARTKVFNFLHLALEHEDVNVRVLAANGIVELVKKGNVR